MRARAFFFLVIRPLSMRQTAVQPAADTVTVTYLLHCRIMPQCVPKSHMSLLNTSYFQLIRVKMQFSICVIEKSNS